MAVITSQDLPTNGTNNFISDGTYIEEVGIYSHKLSLGIIWTPKNPQNSPLRTPKTICEVFLKMSNFKLIIVEFHLNIIPITLYKDIIRHLVIC